jgi:hypothetical protein
MYGLLFGLHCLYVNQEKKAFLVSYLVYTYLIIPTSLTFTVIVAKMVS